jgi:hypothetical protein
MKIVTSIRVPAPREVVWATFLDVNRWPEWSPWTLAFPDGRGLEFGTSFYVAAPMPIISFVPARIRCRVTALERPQVICWGGKLLGVPGYHRFTMEEVAGECLVLSEEQFHGLRAPFLRPARGLIKARVLDFLSCLADAAASAPPGAPKSRP